MRVFILPLFLPIVIFTLCHQPNCQAATFNVSNVSQLISAINSANSNGQSNDVINMTTGTYTLTAVDNSGENGLPIISTSITINGNGSTLTRSAAAPVFRIFYISFFGVAELHNLIISGGKTAATFSDPSGGAIFNNGSLSIFDSTLSGNIATLSTSLGLNQYPGGGAIINFGDLSIYRSTLSGNTVTGGAISGLGGAVCSVPGSSGTLLEDSIFSGNSVSAPGTNGLGYGGAIFGQSTSIVRCTISGNSVSAGNLATGGGALVTAGSVWESTIWNNTVTGGTSPGSLVIVMGGGLYVGDTLVTNCTISGNHLVSGSTSGTYSGSGIVILSGGSLDQCTIASNTGSGSSSIQGGGLVIYGDITGDPNAVINIGGTIISSNTPNNFYILISGSSAISSSGFNIIGDNSGASLFTALGDLNNVNPLIGPLQNNGGPTLTHALLPGSPAIDSGNPLYLWPLTDQRGQPRPTDGNSDGIARVDRGAFEYAPPPNACEAWSLYE